VTAGYNCNHMLPEGYLLKKNVPDYPSVASSFREWPEMAVPEGWESSQIWLTAAANGHLMRIRGSEDATDG